MNIYEIKDKALGVYGDTNRKIVLKSIKDLIDTLNGIYEKDFKDYTADELTRMGGKLALHQFNLLDYKIEAFYHFKSCERELSIKESELRKEVRSNSDKKISVRDLDKEVDGLLSDLQLTTAIHEGEYKRLESMWFSVNTIIGRVESRIRYLLSDNNSNLKNALG